MLGERYRRWLAALARARGMLLVGRLEECEALVQHALTLGLEGKDESAVQAYGAQLVFLRREQNRLAELTAMVEFQVEQYPEVPAWRCGLAYLYAEIGHRDAARLQLETLARAGFADLPRDSFWLLDMALLSEVVSALGGHPSAERLYDLLAPFADRNVVTTKHCQGSVARPLGMLATTLDRLENAQEHFDRALRMNAQIRSPLWVAHTQHAYARMLVKRDRKGDREQAGELLAAAGATAQRLGLPALAERVGVCSA
jgi:tetratricopeptide (TPR) repeat protein